MFVLGSGRHWMDATGKWSQKKDRDMPINLYITMIYRGFKARDTVENTVLASALVLNEDSNRCGQASQCTSMPPELFLSCRRGELSVDLRWLV